MKANELRIGNYISDIHASDSFMAQVRKLDYDRCYYGLFHSSYNDLKPIKLTEEILLKCGFDNYKSNNSWQLDTKFGFSIWGRVGVDFNVYYESDELGKEFKYLHELQNVIFALTNEELTFNNEL